MFLESVPSVLIGLNCDGLITRWNRSAVKSLGLPENPAKEKDSRYFSYYTQFGESSLELDAVEPHILVGLVTKAVISLRDEKLWQLALAREREMRQSLDEFVQQYQG